MKKQLLATIASFAILGPALAVEVTGNAGYNSNYVFRGVEQDKSSANGGIDVTEAGFYAGAWAASVAPGLEVDLYGGWGNTVGEFDYSIGTTGYFYTDDFDDTYLEINLDGSWKFLTVNTAFGEYRNFDGPTLTYTFLSGTGEYKGFFGTLAGYLGEFDGWYAEAGYGDTLSVAETNLFDWSITLTRRGNNLPTRGSENDTYLNFAITKSFTIIE